MLFTECVSSVRFMSGHDPGGGLAASCLWDTRLAAGVTPELSSLVRLEGVAGCGGVATPEGSLRPPGVDIALATEGKIGNRDGYRLRYHRQTFSHKD